ncbi:MAG: hypothetical protein AMQ22_00575 [Candidatus Methanofastidiosum methylothiophilum]|uniref:Glycosyltransferase RgtA/B/C/D-like domain-containing protein n=1 Tax=Candidatus Methanofastidiosum methylothiophilum TaxID=1705564 RepID=A0A150J752_9EURY|nr:MAG: hypothetical protein AMQ22_00575 [Candidatus Methanofastidiosum methylthiophilus]
MKINKYFLAVIILTIVALIIRIYNISYNSIWSDEEFTLTFSKQSFYDIFFGIIAGEFNPPIFFWIEHIVHLTIGIETEFKLRIASAIFGALTIPIFYLIGKEIYNEKGGLIISTLVTFSTFHIFYSQEARAYTLMLLFISLSTLYFIKIIKSENAVENKNWILFATFSALAFWTHFYSFVFTICSFLYGIIFKRNLYKIWGKSIILYSWLSLPIVIIAMSLLEWRVTAPITYGYKGFILVKYIIEQFLEYNTISTALFVYLTMFGLLYLITKRRDVLKLCGFYFIAVILISVILSYVFPFMPKYTIFLLPFFYVLCAGAYYFFERYISPQKAFPIFMIVCIVASVWVLGFYYTKPSKDDWRSFSNELAQLTKDGDNVIISANTIEPVLRYYYNSTLDNTTVIPLPLTRAAIEGYYYNNTKPTYIILHGLSVMPNNDLREWMNSHTEYITSYQNIELFFLNPNLIN